MATIEQHPTKPTMWRVVDGSNTLSDWHTREKARRLAACVNACDGLNTDQLETIALAKHLVKIGKGVALSFIRQIRKVRDCDEHAARLLFEAAVKEGKIRRAGFNGAGDVEYFEV